MTNNFRYADDTVIFADTAQELQLLLDRVVEVSKKYGLEVNTSKTKIMVISKERIGKVQFTINGRAVERVLTNTYLGTVLNEQWDPSQEIKRRITKARTVFNQMSKLFTHN